MANQSSKPRPAFQVDLQCGLVRFNKDMKPIRVTRHAKEQCAERGATENEVRHAIEHGSREAAKHGRELCRFNFPFGAKWHGTRYAIKQVAPVIKEKGHEIVVITVYTFYF